MRKIVTIAGVGLLAALLAPTLAPAKDRARTKPASKPSCERASYPGDPVCDIGDSTGALPMPSARGEQGSARSGYRVSDDVSVAGKSDFNGNRYGGEHFNNTNPNPRSQDVNGGGAVNYRF